MTEKIVKEKIPTEKNSKKKLLIYVLLIAAFGIGGALMAMNGKDAVTLAAAEKNSLLTADTVNQSFQGVGGKVLSVAVSEEQQVKKGDVLMQLDSTDLDIQISKLNVEMEQMDLKIAQAKDGLVVQADKVTLQEKQAELEVKSVETAESLVKQGTRSEDMNKQKLVVESAKKSVESAKIAVETAKQNVEVTKKAAEAKQKSLDLAQTNFEREQELFNSGLVSQSELDSFSNQLDAAKIAYDTGVDQIEIVKKQADAAAKQLEIANNAVSQQETTLVKMQAGATAEEKEQAHIKTEKAIEALNQTALSREDIKNSNYNVQLLDKQKKSLELQLETLEIQKGRMTLTASVDGKVTRVVPKIGELVSVGSIGAIIETDQLYYDIYIDETTVSHFKATGTVSSYIVALDKNVEGTVKYITTGPQYSNLRMSREKGQSDVSSFIVRINVQRTPELFSGMTVEVETDEIAN